MRKNPARLKVVFPVGVSQCMQYVLQADILHPHNPKALPSSAAGRLAGTPWTGPTGPLSLAFRAGWPPPRQMTQVPACGSNYCIVTDVIYPLNRWLSFVSLLLSCLTVKSHPFPLLYRYLPCLPFLLTHLLHFYFLDFQISFFWHALQFSSLKFCYSVYYPSLHIKSWLTSYLRPFKGTVSWEIC